MCAYDPVKGIFACLFVVRVCNSSVCLIRFRRWSIGDVSMDGKRGKETGEGEGEGERLLLLMMRNNNKSKTTGRISDVYRIGKQVRLWLGWAGLGQGRARTSK